jgi:hypothetical protein
MVPWWTLILLTAVFFIREVIMRSREKPNDYDSGYRQAFNDIADWWNNEQHQCLPYKDFVKTLHDFIQDKLKGR